MGRRPRTNKKARAVAAPDPSRYNDLSNRACGYGKLGSLPSFVNDWPTGKGEGDRWTGPRLLRALASTFKDLPPTCTPANAFDGSRLPCKCMIPHLVRKAGLPACLPVRTVAHVAAQHNNPPCAPL